ncbi:restriction endonuclease subunit S [Staphylococcus pseudintermedius]|uniref:restriction endonuclease subunit S n=1 Tax=Staphylococcus pseudintermedius TaxID=283734 RepID=UPI001BDE3ADF|nr:restriction endonuclease subunit S [Staphylococcus pseudintermedius]WMV86728.1 restriction endonuclease subunit S [Staphylococcus pseudintermedius]HAR6169512.1 restriction endonuclease subunit S [Staphylococcus pseudintermedius]
MTEQTNTPELRFPEYKNEWDLKKIGNLANIVRGASPRPIKDSKWFDDNSEVGWLRISDVTQQNGKIKFLQQHLSTEGQKKTRVLHESHLLLSIAASVGKPVINYVKTGVHDGFLIFMKPKFNLYFMFNWLENFQLKWNKYGQPGSQVNLNSDLVRSQDIYIPHLYEEQEKIGNFFNKLDRQIELEEQKLEKIKEQKKGYMQKIFSQELRFKDENGNEYPEWEDKKLLNVIAIQNGYAFKSNLFSEKGMPIIRITDINKSTVKKGTVYYPESIEINERFKIKQYDILIAMSGATTGKVGKYISEKPSLLNQRIGKFVMKKGTDNNFMFTYLNSLYFKKELSKLLVAGAQPNISSQDIENINLFIPINEEQRKIGEFFNELDELIEKQSSKIGVLKQRKKGFLQKMFV